MAFATLLTQIRAAYTGDTDLSAALDEMYMGGVPGGATAAFPYATYHYISNAPSETARGTMLGDKLLQFNIFDDTEGDSITVLDCKDKLTALFDSKAIQSGGRGYKFTRNYDDGPELIEGYWQCTVQYRVLEHPALKEI